MSSVNHSHSPRSDIADQYDLPYRENPTLSPRSSSSKRANHDLEGQSPSALDDNPGSSKRFCSFNNNSKTELPDLANKAEEIAGLFTILADSQDAYQRIFTSEVAELRNNQTTHLRDTRNIEKRVDDFNLKLQIQGQRCESLQKVSADTHERLQIIENRISDSESSQKSSHSELLTRLADQETRLKSQEKISAGNAEGLKHLQSNFKNISGEEFVAWQQVALNQINCLNTRLIEQQQKFEDRLKAQEALHNERFDKLHAMIVSLTAQIGQQRSVIENQFPNGMPQPDIAVASLYENQSIVKKSQYIITEHQFKKLKKEDVDSKFPDICKALNKYSTLEEATIQLVFKAICSCIDLIYKRSKNTSAWENNFKIQTSLITCVKARDGFRAYYNARTEMPVVVKDYLNELFTDNSKQQMIASSAE